MRSFLGMALAGLALLLPAALGVVAHGNSYSPRQYYGGYTRHPRGHYIRPYYYKPTPTYSGYKTHYAVSVSTKAPAITHLGTYSFPPAYHRTTKRTAEKQLVLTASVKYSSSASVDASANVRDIALPVLIAGPGWPRPLPPLPARS